MIEWQPLDKNTVRSESFLRTLEVLLRVKAACAGTEGNEEIGINHVEAVISRHQVVATVLDEHVSPWVLEQAACHIEAAVVGQA